jgi:hypothetical protein
MSVHVGNAAHLMQFVGSIAFASLRGGRRQGLEGSIGAWRAPTSSALQRHIQTCPCQPFVEESQTL